MRVLHSNLFMTWLRRPRHPSRCAISVNTITQCTHMVGMQSAMLLSIHLNPHAMIWHHRDIMIYVCMHMYMQKLYAPFLVQLVQTCIRQLQPMQNKLVGWCVSVTRQQKLKLLQIHSKSKRREENNATHHYHNEKLYSCYIDRSICI